MEKGMIGIYYILKEKRFVVVGESTAHTCTFVLHSGGSNPGMSVIGLSCQGRSPFVRLEVYLAA